MPAIDTAQRRARLGVRHRLAAGTGAADAVAAADAVVALHATDPVTVYLSALARMAGSADVATVEHALYEERSLVRLLGMRRSVFVVRRDLAPVVQAACSRKIGAAQRARLVKDLEAVGVGPDAAGWLADVEGATLAALRARGSATARELSGDVPRLRTTLRIAEGKRYASSPPVTSRVLFQLAVDGHIVRGRPQSGWTTNTYRWWPVDGWLPDGMPALDPDEARTELVRCWLAAFGPAPASDLRWWTGLGVRDLAPALRSVAPVEVDLGGGEPGLVLPDDVEPVPSPEPWAAMLPALDPTPMGWHERSWFLAPEHAAVLVDTSGNVGPTVWWDGRVVGAWAQRRDGEIVYRLLDDVGADGRAALDAAAEALTARIGATRFLPRFPAPLERELRG